MFKDASDFVAQFNGSFIGSQIYSTPQVQAVHRCTVNNGADDSLVYSS